MYKQGVQAGTFNGYDVPAPSRGGPLAPPAGFGMTGGGLPQAGGGITMENLADVRSRLRPVANPEGSAYSRGETPGIGGKYGIRPEDLQAAKSRLRPMVGVNGGGIWKARPQVETSDVAPKAGANVAFGVNGNG